MKDRLLCNSRRPSNQVVHEQATRTPPSQHTLFSSPPTIHHGRAKRFSPDEIDEYLNNSHTLLWKQFQYSPLRRLSKSRVTRAPWSLQSYTTQVREEQIDHKFVISVEALDGAAVPMGREEV